MTAKAAPKIAIIGAGFAGMCMAIQLQKAGLNNFIIYEKADTVGGTWRENTYPGVACDVPSHLYSFSFAPNPGWSYHYSGGEEIQSYAEHCAETYGLRSKIVFGAKLVSAKFEDRWHLTFENGTTDVVDFLISGTGGLHVPNTPDIKGMDDFAGTRFHTAQWQHDHKLEGRDVAVIGTAASALQLIPEIIGKVKSLTVFQRTPNWVMPRLDGAYSDIEKARFGKFGWLRKLHRLRIYLTYEMAFPLFRNNKFFQRASRKKALEHLENQVPDEALHAKLTPDYPIGCKRILASNVYFPALQHPNAALVTDAISGADARGITDTAGTHHAVDTVIFATGFKAFSLLEGMEITGAGGQRMSDYFKDGVRAHNTVSVPGFPNFAFLTGPNTSLGHNSVLLMIEAQVDYIIALIKMKMRRGAKTIDVKPAAADKFDEALQQQLDGTVWHTGCNNWYVGEDSRIHTLWPNSTLKYRRFMRVLDADDFVFERA